MAKDDRELLNELLTACLLVTRCLGGRSGYLPQLGARGTEEFLEKVLEARRHLSRDDRVYAD
jgi:hypothetical protein